jgi:hypothetical protein
MHARNFVVLLPLGRQGRCIGPFWRRDLRQAAFDLGVSSRNDRSLRLHEAGMIKSSPDKIIADGADWSFLREVRRELG